MSKIFVNRKSDLSLVGKAYEAVGFRCYRVRTYCDCQDCGNRRDGLIVLDGDKLCAEVVRCKGCAK